LGSSFINLNPLKVGTGQLVFAADDGKEDGFVLYLVYVNVIDDSETATGITDGMFNDVGLGESKLPALLVPNPITTGTAKLYYKLDEQIGIRIQIFNSTGQLQHAVRKSNVPAGEHVETLLLHKLTPGFYICVLNTEDKAYKSFKLIVK